jgi:hypothetical protein
MKLIRFPIPNTDSVLYLRRIRRQTLNRIVKSNVRVTTVNWQGALDDLADYAIVRWRGIVTGDGNGVLKCNRESKESLPIGLKVDVVRQASKSATYHRSRKREGQTFDALTASDVASFAMRA